MTPRVVVGTAGHIDHGKSALVRALTGIEPDRLKEEQERGITIDLGFAHTEANGVRIAFVDVPGHERFVRNMLAGATGIDAVLLVVAADESVMPQTREHLEICRLLDVRAGVIALTKIDAADADLRAIARAETLELVRGTFLEAAPLVEVSSVTGEGLDLLMRELVALAARAVPRPADGPVRLPIDRVFTLRGFGTVVTGTLVSGTIHAGDGLTLLPAARGTRVRGLHVHGQTMREARAGHRVAVNLGDLQVSDIVRGDSLASPGAFGPTRSLDVRLDLLDGAPALRHGMRVRVHLGTSEVMGRVALARVLGDAGLRPAAAAGAGAATATSAPASLPPGARAYARVRLEAPIVATRGDRFVVRSYSPMTTIGGGLVLDPLRRRSRLRSPASRLMFERLDPGSSDARGDEPAGRAAVAMAVEAGREGVMMPRLSARLGVGPARVASLVDSGVAAGDLVRAGDLVVARDVWRDLSTSLVALVRTHLDTVPHSEGVAREEARDRLGVEAAVFDALVDELGRTRQLAGRDRLSLPGRANVVSESERAAIAGLESLLAAEGLKPPDPADLSARAGLDSATLERALALLARERRIVRLGGLPFHREALDRLVTEVRALKRPGEDARVDVASFKARYGLSRKYAIPLLEFLDRERVTRRTGDVRIVL